MKKLNLNTRYAGYKTNITYILKTNKISFIGDINHKLDIFINNKYIINKHLKFNMNISENVYNTILYNYKKINE